MNRGPKESSDTMGYDSFLDIVANLVGILLILIMVIGFRTRDISRRVAADPSLLTTLTADGLAATHDLFRARREELEALRREVAELQRNVFELDQQAQQVVAATERQRREAEHLQLLVAAAERGLEHVTQTLGTEERSDFGVAQDLERAKAELETLRTKLAAAQTVANQPIVLEHHPTPMAKTVFGREEHFRLLGGQLVHVPLNELIEQLKTDAENKIWKLKHVDEITETLPPQEGFRLKYTMKRRQRREQTDAGPVLRTTVELDRFVLLPVDDRPGLRVPEALQEGSAFRLRLATLHPSETTITVWTYPDSFTEFRQLKDFLASQGFLTAGRPLPEGFPIGGSPDGNRSSAE